MGWVFSHRPKGYSHKDWFQQHVYGNTATLVDVAAKRSVAYAAVYVEPASGDPFITADVIRFRWVPGYYCNFGYKIESELAGPRVYDCPQRILEVLSPLDWIQDPGDSSYEWARKWRAACEERLRRRRERPKVAKGDVIEFAHPIDFGRWGKHKRFEITDLRRNFARPVGCSHDRYRLPGTWRDMDFVIVRRAGENG